MTAPVAAYARKVQIAPDSSGSPGSYNDLELNSKLEIDRKADLVDTSQLNSAGYHQRTATLLDTSMPLDYFRDTTATAQNALHTAHDGRTQCWVKVYETATTGFYFPAIVESFKTSEDAPGVITETAQLMGTGARVTF